MLTNLSVFFPIAAGLLLFFLKPLSKRKLHIYTIITVLATSVFIAVSVFLSLAEPGDTVITLLDFGNILKLSFRIDEASVIFGLIIAVLWPLTAIYAFSYMEHEHGKKKFYSFFIMSFGVVCGIAFAENLFTLYLFYELMTLSTLPLVMHEMDGKARSAGRKYLIYSMIGASLIFIVLVFFCNYADTLSFTLGGITLNADVLQNSGLLQLMAVLGFFGFGVKAAVFPFHGWLPAASVAPTPVTALLHAVAVVKAGAFGILRLIYYCFGSELLYGTTAQYIMLLFAAITIVYGSSMALRSPHLKRRLAYSTISNLSYIVLGFAVMTPLGMTGGLLHMIFHAVIKITLFFCAGAVLVKGKREYVYECEGLAKKMKLTCAVFTIASLGLMGIPPLACFISKFTIASASAATGSAFGIVGAVAIAISAVLTVMYLLTVIIRFYFPVKTADLTVLNNIEKTDKCMSIPMLVLAIGGIAIALCSSPIISAITGSF